MSYLLDSTTIKRPLSIEERNLTQFAQQKTLQGNVGRDYFGDNKRVWVLEYDNIPPPDYTIIRTIYDSYLSTGLVKTWEVTETNYSISSTDVHIDLQVREFGVKGSSYISSFSLILTEA